MAANKLFRVFGDPVEVLHASKATGGAFSVITQICQPGGGPPPHWHDREDEFFMTLEGEFEILADGNWVRLAVGETIVATRGSVHTFRNSSSGSSKILCVSTPGQLDQYLEAISTIEMPQDAQRLFEISEGYGIHFVGTPEPALA